MALCDCTTSINNQLIQKISCTPPIPCPPCVGELEDEILVLVNALQEEINLINDNAELNGWLFNA